MKFGRVIIVILLLAFSFGVYVEIVNRNTRNMTFRQKVLKAIYPIFTGSNRLFGKNSKMLRNHGDTKPPVSIYDISIQLNNGSKLALKELRGKKLLIVNTASDCGFTGQYTELQKLYTQQKHNLVIIGFPANDFKQQEKKSDEEIESFCTHNFGVSFPLAAKSVVIKSSQQNELYKWLTDKAKNGWNEQQPTWNFAKYLVNEDGKLIAYYDPAISPLAEEILQTLQNPSNGRAGTTAPKL